MSVPWLVDFPQAREAPRHVREGLRRLDETAEVVYLGPRHWLVGRVRPNAHVRRIAERMLDDVRTTLSVRAEAAPSRRARVALALLGLQGFRPVAEYRVADLDGRVVREFQESQWRMHHTTDADVERGWDADAEATRAANHRELASLERAREAHRTAFTSNFGAAVASVRSQATPVRSGFQRVATI